MTRRTAAAYAVAALIVLVAAVYAGVGLAAPGGGKGRGNADPSCSANPNPAAVGQSFALGATGLPTSDSVWLITQPPSGSSTVSAVYVNPDGTWSGSETANQSGTWTYTFSGLLSNNKYGAVATCTEQVG